MLSGDAQALLQAKAHCDGEAVPAALRRHVRVEEEPLVLVPLSLAGEDGALLAVGIGRTRDDLEVLVCPEPRDHALARDLLTALGVRINAWLDPLAAQRTRLQLSRSYSVEAAREAPQLVVPTPAAETLLRRLAERMVWQRSDAPDPDLARAGGWLMLFCDRHELAPSDSMLLIATEAQLAHWIPPISGAESAHLVALNEALDPTCEPHPVDAAWQVERRPGSTLTEPSFDNAELQPAIEAYNAARRQAKPNERQVAARLSAIEGLVTPVIERLYEACHDALDRLRGLDPIPPVLERRYDLERVAFTRHADYLAQVGRFARADSLRRGLYLIDDAERELQRVRAEARRHDPLVRAVAASSGEAFDGEVLQIGCEQVKGPKRWVRRLQLEVLVTGPWRPAGEALFELAWEGRTCTFEILELELSDEDDTRVTLRSQGEGVTAARDEVPQVLCQGDPVCFVLHSAEFPQLPLPRDLPWMFA